MDGRLTGENCASPSSPPRSHPCPQPPHLFPSPARPANPPHSRGAFLFSHSLLPFLLQSSSLPHPPTLIFTGATASLKGSAQCSSFATGKHALRALAQSLAREYGPQGVHVAHAIIDGVIDIPRTKEWKVEGGPDAKLSAEAVSELLF